MSDQIVMSPLRPFLFRAHYDWIVENDLTPYVVISADFPGVLIPDEYVQDGRIVLNISPGIVHQLQMGNEDIDFKARFSGVSRHIYAPMRAIEAIYAKENGAGIVFQDAEEYEAWDNWRQQEEEDGGDNGSSSKDKNKNKDKKNSDRSHLKVIK